MLFEILGFIGRSATLILGLVGIIVALRNQNRQLNAQMFLEFSKRFQDLMRVFPKDAWLANRNPSHPLPLHSPALTDCVLYAIQFVADAYYLHKGGYISKSLWVLWEREIRNTLGGPVFQREWTVLSEEFPHHHEFVIYVNNIMSIQVREK